jgi:GNAT superfamily N-acetyltransferase
MQPGDWCEVARLIHESTNAWYQSNRQMAVFECEPASVELFCQVYERLDPGCCLIARSASTQRILGSCFYHPRPSHISLGIMNVHPSAFGKGVARALVNRVVQIADQQRLPLRLVSSLMNLDSYSLYNRFGFVARQIFQDLVLTIPNEGLERLKGQFRKHPAIRPATLDDSSDMGDLEESVSAIRRERDYQHFIENELGIWHVSVFDQRNRIRGWCTSIVHPASKMIGPCVAETPEIALELLKAEIDFRRGETMVFLLPGDHPQLVQAAYRLGARNCELHALQVRGDFRPFRGISMPTFMPETA